MASDAVLDRAAAGAPVAAFAADPAASGGIGYEGVTVAYKSVAVLEDFRLAVRPGEIMALIGPSGSGKTTALRVTAGFVRPTSGRVRIGGRDVTDLPPYARSIGMVVQNYALFPHMRAAENVAFGLRARRTAEPIVRLRVAECLRMVGMEAYASRYPRELSGGQQQRVAIARALAIRPQVLLLDEPLSALDAQIRHAMLDELRQLHRSLPSLTVVYVTHDQTEALTLADRIGIMRDGRLVALGAAQDLYRAPPNRFAAEFLGRANLLPVVVEAAETAGGFARVRFGTTALDARAPRDAAPGRACLLCVRPHDMTLQPAGQTSLTNSLTGRVQEVRWKGDMHDITIEVEGHRLRVTCAPLRVPPAPDATLAVHFAPEDGTLIPADHE